MKNKLRQEVCVIANRFISKHVSRSVAFIKAWVIVKGRKLLTKVNGVSYGIAQKALHKLNTCYNKEDITINLQRERTNLYDSNAIEVLAGVKDKGSVKVGYVPKPLAKLLAPIIDMGIEVKALFKEIRGRYEDYMNYGLEIELII